METPPDPNDPSISDKEARRAVRNWFIFTGLLGVIAVATLVALNGL